MANIRVNDITDNSCFIQLIDLDTNYSRDDRQVDYYFDNEWVGYETIDAYVSRSDGVDIDGLEPDTRYDVEAVINFSSGSPVHLTTSFQTEVGRPNKFYWIDSRNDLTDLPSGVLIENYITASLWRELQENINEVRNYKGYSSYNFSRVYHGDPILASDYNDIVRAIQGISGYGTYLDRVSSGDNITRRIMQKLQDEINAVP